MKRHNNHETTPPASSKDVAAPSQEDEASAVPAAKADGEHAELVSHLQRLQAEFDNYRKRVQREQEERKDAANEQVLRDVLPIVDNIDLALHHAQQDGGNAAAGDMLSGLVMIRDQCNALLERYGAESMASDGAQFNPTHHEALMTIDDAGKKNTVIQTFQRGYLMNGKVLRPAKVSVAK